MSLSFYLAGSFRHLPLLQDVPRISILEQQHPITSTGLLPPVVDLLAVVMEEDLKGIQTHTGQDHCRDHDHQDATELAQDHSLLDHDHHLEDVEELDAIAREEMQVEDGEVQVIVATAVMMTEAEAEAEVVETVVDDECIKILIYSAGVWGRGKIV